MCELQNEGKTRYLGVSNFLPRHFAAMQVNKNGTADQQPQLNQIELHPLCVQADVVTYCTSHNMVIQQYSPLGKGNSKLVQHPALLQLVDAHFRSFTVSDVLIM
uniref:Putative reductase 1 n=1 Tax=Lygus hesperus TaxID=30085 RepID=A0A0A9YUG5_LYGHE